MGSSEMGWDRMEWNGMKGIRLGWIEWNEMRWNGIDWMGWNEMQ
jgi:hypothetical protein